jgi:hypothetical protein
MHALQFASLLLARNRDSKWVAPQAIAFQPEALTAAAWRAAQRGGGGGAEDAGGGEAAEASAAAGTTAAGSGEQAAGLVLQLYRVGAAPARAAANAAEVFSVRSDSDPARRGAELAAALLGGLEAGRLAVVVKCWGRKAMPVATKVGASRGAAPRARARACRSWRLLQCRLLQCRLLNGIARDLLAPRTPGFKSFRSTPASCLHASTPASQPSQSPPPALATAATR